MMKTEGVNSGDPIWTQNVELLPQEGCLPVIGSSQVSSILQNLDPTEGENGTQNMDLIILPSTDFKLPVVENPFSIPNNYVVLKENGATKQNRLKPVIKLRDLKPKKKDNYEDMLYFVCNLCPFLCTSDTKINEHLQNAHKNKAVVKLQELKCPACPNIFYHKMSLRSHLIHDHGVGNSDITPIIQAVVFHSNKSKREAKHKLQVKPVEEMTSISSNDDTLEAIERHESSLDRSKSKPFFLFENIKQLPEIITLANLDPSEGLRCTFNNCKIKLPDSAKLNYHTSCHSGGGFECFQCGEVFATWKPLMSHMWRLHKLDLGLYACDKCDYKTHSLAKLNNIHKYIHGDAKNFSCDVCKKAFKNVKQLRNHKLTHKEKSEKPVLSCNECSKKFSDKRQFRKHQDVVHKKLKPFLCNYCGYKGSTKGSLKMHVRQHTGEKPFACTVCNYATSDHNSLRRHNLRHTGQKPYKCNYCSYACIQTSTYKTHLKTKHPGMEKDLLFTCMECQFRSVNKDMYVMHMVTAHNFKPQDCT